MKKNYFAPIIIILVIAILGVVGYFTYKNYLKSHLDLSLLSAPSATSTATSKPQDISNVVIPNIIDQWNSQVSWDKPTTGNYQVGWMENPAYGIIRKGTISNPDPNPYDLTSQIGSKIIGMGWQPQLPKGASGPTERIATYSGSKNGSNKILVIDVSMVDDIAKTLPTYKNLITIFQEQ